MLHLAPWILGFYLAASAVAFAVYAADKSAARAGRRRTPENTLILLGLVGGWPGALVAVQTLRHKTKKAGFLAALWLSVVLNVAVLVALLWAGSVS